MIDISQNHDRSSAAEPIRNVKIMENAIKVMLENDPNANLNREVPVTPTKPKPATHCQKFIARVLPELQISCFEIKSKDWQAIGELQG